MDDEDTIKDEGVRWVSKQSNLQYHVNPTDLIREVEIRPALYTPDHPARIDPDYRNKLWREISEKLMKNWNEQYTVEQSETVIELQKKWRNIKDCFRKELRIRKLKAEGVPIRKRKYIYFNNLLFLKPIIENQVRETLRKGRIFTKLTKRRKKMLTQDGDDLDLCEDEHEIYEPSLSEQFEVNVSNDYSNNETFSNVTSDNITNCMLTDGAIDEDKTFLLSLVPTLKRMSNDQKLAAKVEILNVLRNVQASKYISAETVAENPLSTDNVYRYQKKRGRRAKKKMKTEIEMEIERLETDDE